MNSMKSFYFSIGKGFHGKKRKLSIPFPQSRGGHIFMTLSLNCSLKVLELKSLPCSPFRLGVCLLVCLFVFNWELLVVSRAQEISDHPAVSES